MAFLYGINFYEALASIVKKNQGIGARIDPGEAISTVPGTW